MTSKAAKRKQGTWAIGTMKPLTHSTLVVISPEIAEMAGILRENVEDWTDQDLQTYSYVIGTITIDDQLYTIIHGYPRAATGVLVNNETLEAHPVGENRNFHSPVADWYTSQVANKNRQPAWLNAVRL